MDQITIFKGCIPQLSLGSFLNTLTHMNYRKTLNCGIHVKTDHITSKLLKAVFRKFYLVHS